MAYVRPLEEEEDEAQPGEQIQVAEQPGGPVSGGTVPSQANAPMQQTQASKGYTDVRSYLDANRPQASQMADVYAGRIGEEGTKIKGKAEGIQKQFGEQVQAGSINQPQAAIDRTIQGATSNPASWNQLQENKDAWNKIYGGQYTGPQGLSDVQGFRDIQGQAEEASKYGESLQTEAGRKGMFTRYGERPTAGNVALDQMLLSQTPEAMGKISAAGQQVGSLGQYLKGLESPASEQAAAAKARTEAAAKQAETSLQGAISGLGTGLDERVSGLQGSGQKEIDALREMINNRGRMAQGMPGFETAGIDPQQWEDMKALENQYISEQTRLGEGYQSMPGNQAFDLSGYINQGMTPEAAYNRGNVATEDEYAREAALEELAGYDIPMLWESDRAKAGTAPQSLAQFDANKAYQDMLGTLKGSDQRLLGQYGSPSLGMSTQREQQGKIEAIVRAFQRNPDSLNPQQKQFLDVMTGVTQSPFTSGQADFLRNNPYIPKENLGDPWAPPEQPKPGQTDFDRLQVIQTPEGGQMKWHDGQNWVDAPEEFKYLKGGQPGSAEDFDTVQQFDYQTGEWKEVPVPEGGWKKGGSEGGVNTGGNVPGRVYASGVPPRPPQQPQFHQGIDQQSLQEYLNKLKQQGTPAGQF